MSKKSSSALGRLVARVRTYKIIKFLWHRSLSTYITAGSVLLLITYIGYFVISALNNALLFNGYAADGAFQMLNPLRRLAAGQAIGTDFNTFHGIGVPLLHLPLYFLFGQGLFASELGRWLLSPALFMMTTFGFFYAFKRNLKVAIIATATITGVAMTTMSLFVLPFTSMLGVRSAMPVLLAMLMFTQSRFKKPLSATHVWLGWTTWYEVLAALLMVICLACGTEFGVAAILAFAIANTFYATDADSTWKTRLLSTARILGMFVVFMLIIFSLIVRGSPLQALRYAFVDIPNDQFWYFGVQPNTFLHLGNVVQIFWQDTDLHTYWFYGVVALVVLIAVHKTKAFRVETQTFLFALLAGTLSMVSMLGYYHNSEAFALARMSLLITGAGLYILWRHYAVNIKVDIAFALHRKKFHVTTRRVMVAATALLVAGFVVQSVGITQSAIRDYDIKKIVRKTKNYITGADTNILDETWNQDDSSLMPIIQADNNVAIADVNDGNFSHGINAKEPQVIVDPGAHAKFLRFGQIVYFVKAGRQIIGKVEPYKGNLLKVTLQNKGSKLSVQYDGAPRAMIIAEDFNHDSTKLWSTYSTLFESEMGTFNPNHQGADYIIHALGPDLRQQYAHDFAIIQPKFVITLKKSYFIYEEWLQNASWNFYSMLDANYEAVQEGTMHVLWKRKDQAWVNPLADTSNWQALSYDSKNNVISVPQVDWSRLPDVNAYINEQSQKLAANAKATGSNIQPNLLVAPDDYARIVAEHKIEDTENTQPRFEGQGHNDSQQNSQVQPPHSSLPNVDLARPKRVVVLVKLDYQVQNPLQNVPLLGKTPRFLVLQNNLFTRTPVSLPPYQHELIFPIIISEMNHDSSLALKTYSLLPEPVSVKITGVHWLQLDTSAANLKELTDWPGPDLNAP